ncbi:hypothetical protein F4815DRAFT_470788 [Daldinia loculata]|nr:hypothetical protein F4815DRAFT_470788 [Daldinia loculata]
MQFIVHIALAGAALLNGANAAPAEPTTLPGHIVCTSVTTITTTVPPVGVCHPVCLSPTRTCSFGEPTAPPLPTITTSTLPSCTEEVVVHGQCGECATCLPAPTPTPLA